MRGAWDSLTALALDDPVNEAVGGVQGHVGGDLGRVVAHPEIPLQHRDHRLDAVVGFRVQILGGVGVEAG